MEKTSNNTYFPHMRRVRQVSDSHCGPATLQMLASHHNINVKQREIREAAGIPIKRLYKHGSTVPELAAAATRLFPSLRFWYKNNSNIDDIEKLIHIYKYPVGVEWRGLFEEYWDGEDGHYSVVTHINRTRNVIVIADPYEHFVQHDRNIEITEFEKIWWDINEVPDPRGYLQQELDYKMLFVLTKKEESFPQILGMHGLLR
jgi:ABC-type bacteriocin/lantibiotic exporter with double-glycine peptidase domain